MGALAKMQNLFNLRKQEVKVVSLLVLYSFFQTMALALFFTTASSIFLTEYPISTLPYVYIVASLLLLSLNWIYARLNSRTPEQRLMLAEVLALLAMIVLFRLGLMKVDVVWIAFGLIVWHRVMSAYLLAGFNRLSLLLFDVRQSKRLFGLITSAETPANGLGYLLASLLAPVIGTANLLWVSAAALFLALIFLALITRKRQENELESINPEPNYVDPPQVNVFRKWVKKDFFLALTVSGFLTIIAFFLIEYAFLSRVKEKFSNQTEITFYLGLILGIGQLIAFFIKTFLYSSILRRFGIRLALYLLPLALGAITLFSMLSNQIYQSTFVLAGSWVLIMLVNETLRSALYNNTFISLLQALQKKGKMAGLHLLGNVEAVAIGVSGLILLAFTLWQGLNLFHFSILLFVILITWLFSIRHLNRSYVQVLERTLKKRILEGKVLQMEDSETIALLNSKLKSAHPGEVLYAMEILSRGKTTNKRALLGNLVQHIYPEVRREALKQVQKLKLKSMMPKLRARIEQEPDLKIRKEVIQIYCFLGEDEVVEDIAPFLDSESVPIQTGALVGLICYGGINGIIIAGQRLNDFIYAPSPEKREFAAHVIGEVGIRHFYHPLLRLVDDNQLPVRRAALKAAGVIDHPRLYPYLLQAVDQPEVFEVAVNSMIQTGEGVIALFEDDFNKTDYNPVRLRRLIHICGKVGGKKAVDLLKDKIYYKNIEVRNQVLNSLSLCGYKPEASERDKVFQTIHAELKDASWFVNCMYLLQEFSEREEWKDYRLIFQALQTELNHLKKRLLLLLSFVYKSNDVLYVWQSLQTGSREKKAKALEILDVIIAKDISSVLLPLLEDFPVRQLQGILNARYPLEKSELNYYLKKLIDRREIPVVNIWTQTVTIFVSGSQQLGYLEQILEEASSHPNQLVAETASYVLESQFKKSVEVSGQLANRNEDEKSKTLLVMENEGMKNTLLAVEKVMALKTTRIFSETAEDLLVDIASILQEVTIDAGQKVFSKGDLGTCMFIIYQGKVKVHDGAHTLKVLDERDFFGELSLLDAEPRSASVTAVEDTLLLRLDQHAFYEIMTDRQEVIREIMKILCRRLRQQNLLVAQMKDSETTDGKGI